VRALTAEGEDDKVTNQTLTLILTLILLLNSMQ